MVRKNVLVRQALSLAVVSVVLGTQAAFADSVITKDANGVIRVTPYTVSPTFQNTNWSQQQQDEFWARATAIINSQGSNTSYGSRYFENEKSSYPKAMLGMIWGVANNNSTVTAAARNFLTATASNGEDGGTIGGVQNTDRVDFYASFTVKGQVAKYFFFDKFSGQQLGGATNAYLYKQYAANASGDDAGWGGLTYRDRFLSGADKWTDDNWTQPVVASNSTSSGYTVANSGQLFADPLYRPNQYHTYTPVPPENWTVAARNSWVDIRGTDNLKAMREIGVYLLAHETGNVNNRDLYAQRYQAGVKQVFNTGTAEWDSANYIAWTIAPHLSMYDYAPENVDGGKTKKQAKALLDQTFAVTALKYWRGGYIAPSARDYGGTTVANGNEAAKMLQLYFGENYAGGVEINNPSAPATATTVHAMLSSYRPPQAIVDLADRKFARNIEILGTKSRYDNSGTNYIDSPRYFETMYYGESFHLGSVVAPDKTGDHQSSPWNIGTFRLAAYNTMRGVDGFAANTSAVTNSGADGDGRGYKRLGDQIAQYRNLSIWLRPADGNNFFFMAPDASKTAVNGGTGALEVDAGSGIHFFKYEKTWVALRPINLTYTSQAVGTGVNVDEVQYKFAAANTPGGYAGFALEVGELGSGAGKFANFNAFKAAILGANLDVSQLGSGTATLHGTDGSFLKMTHNALNDLPTVYRNSATAYDWSDEANFALYKTINNTPQVELLTPITTNASSVKLLADAFDTGNRGPISMGWKTGQMSVLSGTPEAMGSYFEEVVAADGNVTWLERAATSADYQGKVVRVAFFADNVLLGEDIDGSDGWSLDWNNIAAGTYTLQARAFDNDNQAMWSAEFLYSTAAVPEPASLMLLGLGAAGLLRRRR